MDAERRCDVGEDVLGWRKLVRRLGRTRHRPDPTGSAPVSRDSTVGFARSAIASPGATLRRLGTDTYSSISRPRSIAIRWTMRPYSTPIVIFTWAEAAESPGPARATCPGLARRPRRRRRPSRSARARRPSREVSTAVRAARRADHVSLVVRLQVDGAERSLLELLNCLLVAGCRSAQERERDSFPRLLQLEHDPVALGTKRAEELSVFLSATNESPSRRTFIPDSCSP